MTLPDTAYENIGEAIVVVIADGDSHAVHFDIKAGCASNVGERPGAIVTVQMQSRFLAFVAGPIHAVDEQNVLPTVVVVVEKCATRAQCFGQKFSPEGSAIMLKLNSCCGGDVGEAESKRRGRRTKKIARRKGGVKGQAASCGDKLAALHVSPRLM